MCLAAVCLAAGGAQAADPNTAPRNEAGSSGAPLEELLLEVEVNRTAQPGTALILRRPDGTLLVDAADLARWRIAAPEGPRIVYEGRQYVPLDRLSDARFRIDTAAQRIAIEVNPDRLGETDLEIASAPMPPVAPAALGGFLNYDLSAEKVGDTRREAGFFELGAFGPWGLFSTTQLVERSSVDDRAVRLDTRLTYDRPEARTSLRLGDSIMRPPQWGGGARFGGVQYATDFALQPRFIRFPLQTIQGETAFPATADILLNGQRIASRDVPAGPFAIRDLPVVSGRGEVTVVVRDVLGRQQLVTQPYFLSTTLLRQGLEDYSFEAGFLRQNYAIESNDYGSGFAAGTYRRGLTNRITGEVHAEASTQSATVGGGAAFLLGTLGAADLAVAASHGDAGSGVFGAGGVQLQPTRYLSFGARATAASEDFRQIGIAFERPPVKYGVDVFGGVTIGAIGSLGASYGQREDYLFGTRRVAVATFTRPLFGRAFLSLTGSWSKTEFSEDRAASFTIIIPLGVRTSASIGASATRNGRGETDSQLRATLQQNPPYGPGWGYFVSATNERLERVGGILQTDFMTLGAEAADNGEDIGVRVGAAGSLGLVETTPFAARNIQESFGLVRLGNLAGVRVYADNQLAGRTDENGELLLPRLRAYDLNRIRIDPRDVPFDVTLGTPERAIVPRRQAGVVVEFEAKRARAAIAALVLPDGRPVPAGAEVRVAGEPGVHPVAAGGEVYLPSLPERAKLDVRWRDGQCRAELVYPDTSDPMPLIERIVCREVPQ